MLSLNSELSASCAICILTYNRCDQLAATLFNIRKEFEADGICVVVVNNGSSDATEGFLTVLAKDWTALTVIHTKANLGCSKGREVGWRTVSTEYIISLDDDIVLSRAGVVDMLCLMKSSQVIGIVSPIILDSATSAIMNPVAGNKNDAKSFYEGCFLIKSSMIQLVGFFDSALETAGEGLDYSIRMRGAGYAVSRAADVFVHHFDCKRDSRQLKERRKRWLWSFCYVYWKNYGPAVALFYSIKNVLAHCRSGFFNHGFAYALSLFGPAISGARTGRRFKVRLRSNDPVPM